jgi:hypothetical protein
MVNYQDTLPVPRTRIFVLVDGTFVVQWEQNRVQDLLTGKYHPYSEDKFGSPISDWELNQLQSKGIIQRYDTELVYLSSMPKTLTTTGRTFYINTRMSKTNLKELDNLLALADLRDKLSVRSQEYYLIIRGQNGSAFTSYEEATRARELLLKQLPEVASNFVIAFVELTTTI